MNELKRHWLDANILIQANRVNYKYRIAKTFWVTLASAVESRRVVMPKRVYRELVEQEKHQDFVKHWVKVREQYLSQMPSPEITEQVGEIQKYIFSHPRFDQSECWRFSGGGDPWVIAHAFVDKGTVVTYESAEHPNATKPLVPNICRKFGVRCTNTLGMFEDLGLTF